MSARCETIGKHVLPIFRSLVAKELVKTYHFTQMDVAQKLGTTQAAISQYISSKRAFKRNEEIDRLMPKIQVMATETAKRIADNKISRAEITVDFCELCSSFCQK